METMCLQAESHSKRSWANRKRSVHWTRPACPAENAVFLQGGQQLTSQNKMYMLKKSNKRIALKEQKIKNQKWLGQLYQPMEVELHNPTMSLAAPFVEGHWSNWVCALPSPLCGMFRRFGRTRISLPHHSIFKMASPWTSFSLEFKVKV